MLVVTVLLVSPSRILGLLFVAVFQQELQSPTYFQCFDNQDPLFRFFEREVKMGAKLLQDVRQDLADVVQVCEGKKKQTNYLRTLINELVKGMVI